MQNGKTVMEQHTDINNTNTGDTISLDQQVSRSTSKQYGIYDKKFSLAQQKVIQLRSNPRTFVAISEVKIDMTQERTLSLLYKTTKPCKCMLCLHATYF
jgi:hypothetical protein